MSRDVALQRLYRVVNVMMKKSVLFWALIPLLLAALACNFSGETPPTATPIPLLSLPGETTEAAEPPTAVSTASSLSLPATSTPLPSPEAATATAVSGDPTTPTAVPATLPPTAAAAGTTAVPQTGDFFSPGQQDRPTIEPGGFRQYSVQGQQFQPFLFFAETASDADLLLATIAGTAPFSGRLADLQPLAQADFSPAARPEVLIYSPDADTAYSLIVGNKGPARGETAVYLFDAVTDAPLATHYRGETLAAGQSKSFPAQSNGGRPVIAFVDPLDQSDLVLRIKDAAGSVLTEANFSGPGSAEAVFVLPLRTTDYVIEVGEVNGRSASFTLVVVRLN
jgi:hypothetical protein